VRSVALQLAPLRTTFSMDRAVSGATRRVGSILLVDDYDDARLGVREALEDAGYGVIEAQNGQAALNFLVSRPDERISLIVLDLQMPIMDGWRLLELLRCYVRLSKIPVIVASAQDAHLERTQHSAIVGCLRAPYKLNELVDLVDSCMAGTRNAGADPLLDQRARGKA
jgi:CheY-like chemotaxis protein